jgi:hypothetical protein
MTKRYVSAHRQLLAAAKEARHAAIRTQAFLLSCGGDLDEPEVQAAADLARTIATLDAALRRCEPTAQDVFEPRLFPRTRTRAEHLSGVHGPAPLESETRLRAVAYDERVVRDNDPLALADDYDGEEHA